MILKSVIDEFSSSEEFKQFIKYFNTSPGSELLIEGIAPSSFPVIIASIYNHCSEQIIIVTENSQKMQKLYVDLTCLVDESRVCKLPPWETLPYEFVSPIESVERHRITSLYRMLEGSPMIIITTVESLIRKLPHKSYFIQKGVTLNVKDDYPFDDLVEMLVTYGYTREFRVEAFSHFSVKGGIIDIFLPSQENPVRLDFFGDTLESIREFDIGSQVSIQKLKSITIYPRRELILFSKEKEKIYKILKEASQKGMELTDEIENQIDDGKIDKIRGIEDIFPLIIEDTNLPSYFPEKHRVIFLETQELISKKNLTEKIFRDLYKKKKDKTLCLKPDELLDTNTFDETLNRSIQLQAITTSAESLKWNMKSIPNYQGKMKFVREEISQRLKNNWKVIVTTGFEGQARRLYDLLSDFEPDSNFEVINKDNPFNIIISPYKEGLELKDSKITIISDNEIFGKSYRKKKQFKKKTSRPIDSFLDLKPDDFVVHINHGIGIFKKIERMSAGGIERDFLMIEYAESDKLYVSLDQITMVQKYIGMTGKKPRIDCLGKKSAWNRIKKKAQEAAEEIAKELLQIYSKRSALKGFQYPPDTSWQEEFETLFEYEETPDQITAVEDVKDDMEKNKPMDRLICGDVGFGKTEIAIRAAFKSVMAGKQVAILVPTTILAMQHFSTFVKRFSDYPIEIDMISRFRSPKQIREAREKLSLGQIDIIIGTHALLGKDISIKNLGLLIIDEEQKFGVRHKEKLKIFRSLVDVLTLTATPIPRTLHMSLAGIRDLSIIATPPENRQSIETYVMEDNPDILRMAILNEVERGGQVFFVHNRVKTIDAHAAMLEKLMPEISIAVAHGQMHEHELEDIMIDFMNKKYDLLLSTTIIESGLDIPNVNTIIINRADTFGLSQLYQLKGRVGRSTIKAYAYLFYPKHVALTEEAQKRLQVISEYSELGSGFKIAMKDLEIRGAGNILGKEQSGSIMDVGFDLYSQMLEDSIKKLKGEQVSTVFRTPLFINTDFYIPDNYINDERQKIEFYKRYESCMSIAEVDKLTEELIDRFGLPPEEVKILIELERLRALASSLLIEEIVEDSKSIKIKISKQSKIDLKKLVEQIKIDPRLSVDPENNEILIFRPNMKNVEKKLVELKKWLQQISQ
ncbi:transcription-repair coupling factor [Spirochaetota bacterium]